MSKRKPGAKENRTRNTDTAYPDTEEIAQRLRIGPPPSIGVRLVGRFAREQWIKNNVDLDLELASDDSTAPSPLSHLLTACLRLRGLSDLDDPRRTDALRERAEILVLLDTAARRLSVKYLQDRAMELAREIEVGRKDWPSGPREFVAILTGQPYVRDTETQLNASTAFPWSRPDDPEWLKKLIMMIEVQDRKGVPYALETLIGLENQSELRATPWICDHILTPAIGRTVSAENGLLKSCLSSLVKTVGILESRRGGKPGYRLDHQKWAMAKDHPYIRYLLDLRQRP